MLVSCPMCTGLSTFTFEKFSSTDEENTWVSDVIAETPAPDELDHRVGTILQIVIADAPETKSRDFSLNRLAANAGRGDGLAPDVCIQCQYPACKVRHTCEKGGGTS